MPIIGFYFTFNNFYLTLKKLGSTNYEIAFKRRKSQGYSNDVRIGLIHSYYRSEYPSGENLTVNQIIKLLGELGHVVTVWSMDSDEVSQSWKKQLAQAARIIFSKKNRDSFDSWINNQDVVQIHNYFPAITYDNLKRLQKSNIKIYRVIHNYRKTCIKGSHFRLKQICNKCSLKLRLPGVIKRCYNNNFITSAFVANYSKKINSFEQTANLKYIAISETISHYLKENGISEEKVKIIPNSVPVAIPISKSSRDCVFFGRIEEEKGIFELIEAWRIGRELPTLHVIGGGTKLNEVQILAKPLRNVIIHGAKYGSELDEILHKSKVAIFPGAWKEPFGRTLVESLARGHAIATTKNFSQHDLVIEGINGSIFNLDSLSIIESVQECLALDIVNQIKTSRNAWQKNFSPASVSRFWDQNYNDKLNNI